MHIHPPIVAAIAAGAIMLADAVAPVTSVGFSGQRTMGAAIAVAGVGLAGWAFVHFRRARTTVLPDRLDERAPDMTTLITDGPFAFSRNPIYLGMALLVSGIGLRLGSLVTPFAVAAFVWYIQARQIIPEEQVLAARFGPEFAAYAVRVNRWLGRRPVPSGITPA